MRQTLAITLLTVLSTFQLKAQGILIEANFVYGTFAMNDLKSLQEEFNQDAVVYTHITDQFPAYGGWELRASKSFVDRWLFGIYFSSISTGGRNYYADYSGYYKIDQKISNIALGGTASYLLNPEAKLQIYAEGKIGACRTMYNLSSELKMREVTIVDESLDFSSLSLILEPALSGRYSFNRISIFSSIGYQINTRAKLKIGDGHLNVNGSPASANWSGLRLSVGLGYTL